MITVTVGEFRKNTERYRKVAFTEPVAVAAEGDMTTVLLSEQEYIRLKARDRDVLGLDDFSEDDLALLEATRAPIETKALDIELS